MLERVANASCSCQIGGSTWEARAISWLAAKEGEEERILLIPELLNCHLNWERDKAAVMMMSDAWYYVVNGTAGLQRLIQSLERWNAASRRRSRTF